MSEPEIARRCLSCGASVRQRASFCPQCGQVLGESKQQEHGEASVPVLDEEQNPAASLSELPVTQTQAGNTQTSPQEPLPRAPETRLLLTKPFQREPTFEEVPEAPTIPLTNAPIDGAEDPAMGRVERFKKVSTVMIDQAAYDPSLRFLLVAAALFVLFVILMILSKVIG